MLISRKNYESFFLDFIEGRLNAEDEAGLMAFLSENPDLQKELDNFQDIHLITKLEIFPEKNSLKKNLSNLTQIDEINFDQFCIAKMEGDLNEHLSREFEIYLSEHPEKLKEYKLLLQTFLEPDKSVVFSEKQKLRHRQITPSRNRLLTIASVAASLALIVVSYQFYNTFRVQDKKIYTAIHDKLKIDSLLTAKILGPVEEKPIIKEVKSDRKHLVAKVEKRDTVIKHMVFKAKKPIEIVQLEIGNELNIAAPILRRPTYPIAPIEKRQDYLTVREYAANELKKRLELDDLAVNEKMTFWKAAQTGVNQLNKLAGTNIKMDKQYDSLNNRTKVIIHTNLLSFYTSSKK